MADSPQHQLGHLVLLAGLCCVGSFVHDMVLPHHKPKECQCAPWSSNASSQHLWANRSMAVAAGPACSMPALALTPDLALPVYSPSDGWCLCAAAAADDDRSAAAKTSSSWYTWCAPPAAFPSQINLLVVNATAVVVNFVTADEGARAGCEVEAELTDAAGTVSSFVGSSTAYRDSEGSRVLSYHHVTLHSLAERTAYAYRVRVSNRTAAAGKGPTTTWSETTRIKWCSGGNWDPGNPFGGKRDGICPVLPADWTHAEKIARCQAVCAAPNASACAGFTFYPEKSECCFRTNTANKPPDPASTAECYEKHAPPPCTSASEWSASLDFRSLYTEGITKLALYADMGVFVAEGKYTPPVKSLPSPARHHVGNLVDDLKAGLIDFALHSGDHAYEFEVNDGARGDGYMDSYSAFLAHAPWAPGWGNHEYLEGDRGNRLANITVCMHDGNLFSACRD
jgi:hypothetical protein